MSVGWDLATALDKNFSKQGAPRRAGSEVFCLGPRP